MIKPTIGRVVWFYPGFASIGDQPFPAFICYVLGDRLINVAGFDKNGSPFACQGVRLVQEGEQYPEVGENYATWMPDSQPPPMRTAAGDAGIMAVSGAVAHAQSLSDEDLKKRLGV